MSSLGNELCSIIMPVYNGEAHVAEAIQSVLMQDYERWELLVVDDASIDRTAQIVRQFAADDVRIRLFQNEKNQGVSESRNRAIAQATGDYLAFLDADDAWDSQKLTIQLLRLRESGDVCYTSYAFMDAQSVLTGRCYTVPRTTCFHEMLVENVVGCSTVVMRREMLGETRFRTEYAHEDYVLWLELLQKDAIFIGCTEILVRYRVVGGRSADKKKAAKNRWRIYRVFLQFSVVRSCVYFYRYALKGIRKHYMK